MLLLAIAAANVNRVFAVPIHGISGDVNPREHRGGGVSITLLYVNLRYVT